MTQLVWSPWFNNFGEFLDDFSNVFNREKLWGGFKKFGEIEKYWTSGLLN